LGAGHSEFEEHRADKPWEKSLCFPSTPWPTVSAPQSRRQSSSGIHFRPLGRNSRVPAAHLRPLLLPVFLNFTASFDFLILSMATLAWRPKNGHQFVHRRDG
jgi:hypothetical protein